MICMMRPVPRPKPPPPAANRKPWSGWGKSDQGMGLGGSSFPETGQPRMRSELIRYSVFLAIVLGGNWNNHCGAGCPDLVSVL